MALTDTITAPTIKSIGAYEFGSRSAQELYGDDQLVNVWFADNPWFVAAACFRAPRAMSFGDFWGAMIVPFAEEDPDWPADATPSMFTWGLDGQPWSPQADQSIYEQGVDHKSVISLVKA